jgi:predicted DNA-binding protein
MRPIPMTDEEWDRIKKHAKNVGFSAALLVRVAVQQYFEDLERKR